MDCSDAYCPPKDRKNSRLNIKATQFGETSETGQRTHTDVANRQMPHRPDMAEFKARVMTFSRNWPNHIKATAVQLAQAGLYYLGTSDRVKCFHCNGGLKDWTREDDPWFEHCKWYPSCEFLREKKGLEYVNWVSIQFPNLKRPAVYNKNGSVSGVQGGVGDVPPPANRPEEVLNDTNTSMDCSNVLSALEEAKGSELYQEALNFGFDKQVVEAVVKKHLETEHEMYTSLMKLVTDVQEYKPPSKQPSTSASTTKATETKPVETFEPPRTKLSAGQALMMAFPNSKKVSYKQQAPPTEHQLPLEKASEVASGSQEEDDLCKVCLDSKCDCVLMTCGHVCSCTNCASALRTCPICRARIESIVKFYRN